MCEQATESGNKIRVVVSKNALLEDCGGCPDGQKVDVRKLELVASGVVFKFYHCLAGNAFYRSEDGKYVDLHRDPDADDKLRVFIWSFKK